MKKILPLLLVALAAAIPWPLSAQTVLRFNGWLPPGHPLMADSIRPWADDVAAATGQRVRLEFTTQSLGPPPAQFDMVRDGIVDAAITVHGQTPARFVLMQAGELPFLSDRSESLSVALWRVTQAHFAARNEHAGTRLLTVFTAPPGRVWTTQRPLRSLQDWQGLKFAGGAAVVLDEAQALGAVGVRAAGPPAVDMLRRGVVDGIFIDLSSFSDFRLGGTVKHLLDFPRGIHAATFPLVINEAKWNAIAPADRAAIEALSGEVLARRIGRNWDRSAAQARDSLKAAGVEVTRPDGAYFRALQDRLRPLEDEWLRKAAAAGVDGRAALAALRQHLCEAEPPCAPAK